MGAARAAKLSCGSCVALTYCNPIEIASLRQLAGKPLTLAPLRAPALALHARALSGPRAMARKRAASPRKREE